MKIAYVLGEYPSLSETFIAREIEALRKRGFQIDVWALRAGEGAKTIPTPALSAARAWRKLTQSDEKYWHAIGLNWAKCERESLADVAHIHAGWASFPADIARGAAGVLPKPWSFSGHARDLWVEGENLAGKLSSAKFASVCTRAGAKFLRQQFLHNCFSPEHACIAENKILYAPHGIEILQFPFAPERKFHTPIRLLSVGRLVEKKGLENLLLVLASLQNLPRTEFHLTIIGDGPLRKKLQREAELFKLQNCVTFAGALPMLGVLRAMQNSDLLIQSSVLAQDGDRDGLPNVLLEAAACGLPIVSTRAGAIEDFLDENCAWLWPRNSSMNAELITRAIELYPRSLEKARAARRRVEGNFDIEKNIEVLARAFENDEPRA